MLLSPQQAAKKYSVSRSKIMRAIYDKSLISQRDNSNRWKIESDDIETWLSVQSLEQRTDLDTDRTVTSSVQNTDRDSSEINDLRVDLATARATIDGLEARLKDTQADRDRLASMLKTALEARPVIEAPPVADIPVKNFGFWRSLFKR